MGHLIFWVEGYFIDIIFNREYGYFHIRFNMIYNHKILLHTIKYKMQRVKKSLIIKKDKT